MSKLYDFLMKYNCTSTAMLPSLNARMEEKIQRYHESIAQAKAEEEFIAGEQAKEPVVIRVEVGRGL